MLAAHDGSAATCPEAFGETEALQHSPREILALVLRQMQRLASGHRDFDDLVQKGFLEVLSAQARFRGESRFETFVWSICYRVWMKHLRGSGRWFRRFAFSPDGELPERADEACLASEGVEQRETWRRLDHALGQLSPKRRVVVVLHDLEGLDVEEIAEVISVGHRTVRSRLRDGRKALRRLLENDPYFCPGEGS